MDVSASKKSASGRDTLKNTAWLFVDARGYIQNLPLALADIRG